MPYALKLDVVSSSVIYKGEAVPGANTANPIWRVAKITVNGSAIDIKWPNGRSTFDQIWDNRASFTYS